MSTSVVKDLSTQHGKFKVSLPSNVYNAFVPHNNFKGSLDIGYINHSDEHVETTQTGTNGEKFIIQLNEKRHYCNQGGIPGIPSTYYVVRTTWIFQVFGSTYVVRTT